MNNTFLSPLALFSGSWRYRLVNGVAVYSIDHSKQTSDKEFSKCPTIIATLSQLTENFLAKMTLVTHVHEWMRDNAYTRSHLKYMLISANNLASLEHLPEQRSVRALTLKVDEPLVPSLYEHVTDVSLTVVYLRAGFTDRRSGEIFMEYILLGVLPYAQFSERPTLSGMILNTASPKWRRPEQLIMQTCRLPSVRLAAYADGVAADTAFSDEQLLSFCVRWHVARVGRQRRGAGTRFIETIVASTTHEEALAQLFSCSVRFFRVQPAAVVLFGNDTLLVNLLRMWASHGVSVEHRSWMARQLADAVAFIVDACVVRCSRAARQLFFDDTVLPALKFFMPHLRIVRVDAVTVRVQQHSQALSRVCVDLHKILEAHPPLANEGEQPLTYTPGFLTVPLSTGCFLYAEAFAKTLQLLATDASSLVTAALALTTTPIETSVFPLRGAGGEKYASVRVTRLDDFPLNGSVFKMARALSGPPSARSDEPAALLGFDLPGNFGMNDAEKNNTDKLSASSQSIPLRHSSAVIPVSNEALHNLCSNSATDIEDLGDAVVATVAAAVPAKENAVAVLHRRFALPLCARRYTHIALETKKHLEFAQRNFLYRFLSSLRMADIDYESIAEFLMMNTEPHRSREYVKEIDGLRKFTEKSLEQRVQKKISSGASREHAVASVSCMCACKSNASEKKNNEYPCPYANTALGTVAGSDEKLTTLLAETNSLLKDDRAAIERIVNLARTSHSVTSACLHEFTETQRKLDAQIPALAAPTATIFRPVHYVYSAAKHTERTIIDETE